MDVIGLIELKEMYSSAVSLCDTIEDAGFWPFKDKMQMRDVLRLNIIKFLMYLSASDGHVSIEEATAISVIFGDEIMSPMCITDLIKENDIYSTNFESSVPLIILGANAIDKALPPRDSSAAKVLRDVFGAAGAYFISCDGIEGNEVSDLKIYMDTIDSYLQNDPGTASYADFIKT